jgi:hypothetical protein
MLIQFTLLFAAILAVTVGWHQLVRFSSILREQFSASAQLPQNILGLRNLASAHGSPLLMIFGLIFGLIFGCFLFRNTLQLRYAG